MGSRALAFVALLAALCSCTAKRHIDPPQLPGGMTLTSTAFADSAPIPTRYTCDGKDVSPPLAWSAPPEGTDHLTLVVVDVDAGSFIHWSVGRIEPATRAIRAGAVPAGSVQSANSFKRRAYGGPCPPVGKTHRYRFRVEAFAPGKGIVASGDLIGTYGRIQPSP